MFQVSDKAGEMMKEYLKDRGEDSSIRVILNEGG